MFTLSYKSPFILDRASVTISKFFYARKLIGYQYIIKKNKERLQKKKIHKYARCIILLMIKVTDLHS